MSFESIYVSWVDLLAGVLLVVGIRGGRKRGMSEEVLFLLQWATIVVVAGFGYEFLGSWLARNTVFSLLFSRVTAYVVLAVGVKLTFSAVRSRVGEKLVQGDAFGSGEYYWGMVAGAVKFGLILVVSMALLNSRYFTNAEVSQKARYQEVNFGSVFFPSLADIQAEVFNNSWTGRLTHEYLSLVLIMPTAPQDKPLRGGAAVHARERALNEVLDK